MLWTRSWTRRWNHRSSNEAYSVTFSRNAVQLHFPSDSVMGLRLAMEKKLPEPHEMLKNVSSNDIC